MQQITGLEVNWNLSYFTSPVAGESEVSINDNINLCGAILNSKSDLLESSLQVGLASREPGGDWRHYGQ